jgi:hypothetical protein
MLLVGGEFLTHLSQEKKEGTQFPALSEVHIWGWTSYYDVI